MDECSSKNNKKKQGNSSNSQKTAAKVQKKPRKRVKGQKDIRTLIKPKKNELVTYSKDFDLICKQSGIDVDPEQLQLAIALSKSLQDSETVHKNSTNTQKSLTSNQRKGIIRVTLQEYGFKVPDIKHHKIKKVNRHRKQYKLLLATDVEKQERIANKYAQILFTNVSICHLNEDNINCENSCSFLYHISTNTSYKHIKSDAVYYVNNLVEIPLTDKHHILRDWSEIPGRPRSPLRELPPNIYFKSLDCTQEELDSILSGTVEAAQEIVKYCSNKLSTLSSKKDNNPNCHPVDPIIQDTCLNSSHFEIKENLSDNTFNKYCITSKSIAEETFIMPPPASRSYSPDIFDDEVTIIMDKSKDTITLQEDLSDGPMVREQNDYMDLTECVNVLNCNTINFKQTPCLSQENNKTKINPNDLMELTDCVSTSSQKVIVNTESGNFSGKENCSPNVIKNSQNTIMDLTQSPNSNNSSQVTQNAYANKSLDDTIIVVDEDYSNFNSGSSLSKLAIQKSDIVDLVESPQIDYQLNSSKHNSFINLIQSPEKNRNDEKGKTNNFNFQSGKMYSSYIDTKKNFRSPRHDSLVEDNEEGDAMDLTQSSNSEDGMSLVHMREYSKIASITSNDGIEKGQREKQIDSPLGSYHSNDKEYHYGDTSNSPIFMNDYDDFYRSDSPLNDIPTNYSNNPNHNKSKDSNHEEEEEEKEHQDVDLTQSPPYENTVNIDHKYSSTSGKSLDGTIVLNEDYNEIRVDEIDPISLENGSPHKDAREQILLDESKVIMNEYSNYNYDIIENVVENVSITNHNTNEPLRGYIERDLPKYSETSTIENDGVSNSKKNQGLYNMNNDSDEKNHEIDLTQQSDGAEDIFRPDIYNVYIPDDVGERNNDYINYDNYVENECSSRNESDVLIVNAKNDPKTFVAKEKSSSTIDEAVTNFSQNTAVFEISDDEFNYSINQPKEDDNSIRLDRTRFNIGGTSAIDEFLNRKSSLCKSKLRCSCGSNIDPNSKENKDNICLPEIAFTNGENLLGAGINKKSKSCSEIEPVKVLTPSKSLNNEDILFVQTPRNTDYIIKTDVTPMPNYERMTSPERNAELDKFGIKPLKRKRAIQILTHIYDQTHPVMEVLSDTEDYSSPSKIRKRNDQTSFPRRAIASQMDLVEVNNYIEPGPSLHLECLSQKSSKSRMEVSKYSKKSPQSTITMNKECNLYEETKHLPDIKNIECCPEDWVFQKREKAKVHSCRVPLHIAFHNYVSCRQALREAILKYEPINIDDIHKGLVATGYRYNPKDLLKFMDKKCITVKTADNNRNAIK